MKNTIIALVSLAAIGSAHAYTYAITGNLGSGSLDADSIYRIDNSGATTLIGATAVTGNAFAYDTAKNIFYYGDHGGTDLYEFNATTGTNTLLGDLTSYGMPTGRTLSGGADFYNGSYYYIAEVSADAILRSVSFSSDGLSIAAAGPTLFLNLPTGWSDGLGDFGDFAIDPATGILYASSQITLTAGGFERHLWSVDLADPTLTVTSLGITPSVYQLAFNEDGWLFANEWQTDGNYYRLSREDGTILSTVSTGGDFYDLATSVPEPGSSLLAGLGLFGLLVRRKR